MLPQIPIEALLKWVEKNGDIYFNYETEYYNAGFGQGITTTPIQNIKALTSIANERVPTGGWKCKKCGAGNYSYVGTCGCGNPKIASIDNTSYKVNVSSNIPKPMIQEKKAEKIVVSAADEILKFKKLCDDGIITTEEFEKKKTQLLNL